MPAEFELREGTASDSRAAFDVDPYLTHLAERAAEWWIAEDRKDGKLIGYARSVERDGLFELSALFERPDNQSAGLGKALLDKAFPSGRGKARATIATNDVRALARYYGAGTAARFAMFSMTGQPKRTAQGHEALRIGAADIGEFAQLDLAAQRERPGTDRGA